MSKTYPQSVIKKVLTALGLIALILALYAGLFLLGWGLRELHF